MIAIDQLRNEIVSLLMSTQRPGTMLMVQWLDENGYFESPASTKYHGCYAGGLAAHSLGLYKLLTRYNKTLNLGIEEQSLVIAALLHDVCKVGAYLGTSKPYGWNRSQPKGHALLSLERIKQFIELTEIEELMVRYHMGVYGLTEFDDNKGEYSLRGGAMANAWYHHPIVKIMYFCDEIATLSEKASEKEVGQ